MGWSFDAEKVQEASSALPFIPKEGTADTGDSALPPDTDTRIPLQSADIKLTAEKKKKKKKYKKNKQVGTGFEDFYADAPIRPLVAKEEESLYSSRMEIASERYRRNRKWDMLNSQIFSAYLYLAGIQSSTRSGSIDEATSSKFVTSASESCNFDHIDFEHIVSLFLSYYMGQIKYWTHGEYLHRAPVIVANFLRYLVHHDVLPEFNDQLRSAIKVAELAKTELPLLSKANNSFPGPLNTALSKVFAGFWFESSDEIYENHVDCRYGILLEDAKSLINRVFGDVNLTCSRFRAAVKILEIEDFIEGYKKVHMQTCLLNGSSDYLPEEILALKVIVCLEERLAELVFCGSFIDADFYGIDNGFHYLDRISGIYPSFYTEADLTTDKETYSGFSSDEATNSP